VVSNLVRLVGYEDPRDGLNNQRQKAVKEAFQFAYGGYEKNCFGSGELLPVTGQCVVHHALGLSILDSLDTMLLMGETDFFNRALEWLKTKLDWNQEINVSVFEVNIRCLGGLLSAYHLTKDPFFLEQAKILGDHLLVAFDSPNGLPYTWLRFLANKKSNSDWTGGHVILSEFGSVQLEFAYLSQVTKNTTYYEKALSIYAKLIKHQPADKLYPVFARNDSPEITFSESARVGVGALSDSFYEYQLKYWLLTNRKNPHMEKWYYETAEAILAQLGVQVKDDELMITEREFGRKTLTMEHLSCFSGGMFALGSLYIEDPVMKAKHLKAGADIGKFCYSMYKLNPTGLPCDNINIDEHRGNQMTCVDNQYIMRPEAVETWFYLYRITGDKKYREWGWEFFESIQKHTKQTHGYSGLRDARSPDEHPEPIDKQESFFLAETLKYLYLLFSPVDVMPIDKIIFNTEAHPFPLFDEQELSTLFSTPPTAAS